MYYIILDLEWNNTYCKKKKGFLNEILEIGAVKLDENLNQIDTFSLFIKAQLGKKLQTRVKELTNISNDDVRNAPTIDEVLPKFVDFIEGCILVGHNVTFDNGHLYHINFLDVNPFGDNFV